MPTRFRPSPAMIVACVALLVALGGTSYAVTQLPQHSVGRKQLRPAAVTTSKLANGAVSKPKLAANAVTGAKVRDGSLTGADVVESTLGKVPAATSSDQLGGSPPSAFQPKVREKCPGAAVEQIGGGPVQCSAPIPLTAAVSMSPGAGGFDGRLVGNDIELDVLCHYPGFGGGTKVRIINEAPAAATLNWLYSDGSSVSASGTSIAGNGTEQPFDFEGKRLEGQFIYARGSAVTTINLHAFDGGSFCEVAATAQGAPSYVYPQSHEGSP